jgi:hypothetical protein
VDGRQTVTDPNRVEPQDACPEYYARRSLGELRDVAAHIDRERHPERWAAVEAELARRTAQPTERDRREVEFAEHWDELTRRTVVSWAALAGCLVVLSLAICFLSPDAVLVGVLPIVFALYAAAQWWRMSFPCPACGKPFFIKNGGSYGGGACMHCGLEPGAAPPAAADPCE